MSTEEENQLSPVPLLSSVEGKESASAVPPAAEALISDLQRQLAEAKLAATKAEQELRTAVELERQYSIELENAYHDTILRLTRASCYKDRLTGSHIQRVSHYAKIVARELGWSAVDQDLLFHAAPMHDLGKIAIPDKLLGLEGSLSEDDRKLMEGHTVIGAKLLDGSNSPLLNMARDIALTHHERWDGSGYPRGLKGEEIPMTGRIVALCDHYDALRSARSYKIGFDHQATLGIMLEGDERSSPSHFDPHLLEIFRKVHHEFDAVFEQLKDQ